MGIVVVCSENEQRQQRGQGNRWVVAPFGLHSGLRQSRGRCAAGFFERPKAEALGYPEARTTAKSKRRDARVPRRCSGQAFPLRASLTVQRSGEMTLSGWQMRKQATAKTEAD